jgi:hypothetical protein
MPDTSAAATLIYIVMVDHIRPDWEAKLAAVRAAVTRRANRRIIMRQVGDRLIPVGVTSGRVHALSPEEAASAGENQESGSGSRRSRRRQQGGGGNNLDHYIGIGGQDLEEVKINIVALHLMLIAFQLMVMEAMRLSLLEHEEQQRKEREAEEKKSKGAAERGEEAEVSSDAGPSSLQASSPASQQVSTNSSGSGASSQTDLQSKAVLQPPVSSNHSIQPSVNNTNDTVSNSQPFKALGAAVSAASLTASAIVPVSGSGNSTPSTINPGNGPASSSTSMTEEVDLTRAKTTGAPGTPSRPVPVHQDTQMSSLSVDTDVAGPSYDQLASSPESAVDRRPLLVSESPDTDSGSNRS